MWEKTIWGAYPTLYVSPANIFNYYYCLHDQHQLWEKLIHGKRRVYFIVLCHNSQIGQLDDFRMFYFAHGKLYCARWNLIICLLLDPYFLIFKLFKSAVFVLHCLRFQINNVKQNPFIKNTLKYFPWYYYFRCVSITTSCCTSPVYEYTGLNS